MAHKLLFFIILVFMNAKLGQHALWTENRPWILCYYLVTTILYVDFSYSLWLWLSTRDSYGRILHRVLIHLPSSCVLLSFALYHFLGPSLQIIPWYHLRFSQRQSGKDLGLRQEVEVLTLSENSVILGTLPGLCLQFSYLGFNSYFIWLL